MAFPIRIIYRLPEIEFHCVIGRRYTKSMISFLLPCETRFLKIYIRKQMSGGDWLTESLEKLSGERLNLMKLMKHTIFDNFLICSALRWISLFILRIFGWKVRRNLSDVPQCVIIAAPHTSNWDFVLTLLVAFAIDIRIYIMAKKELTEWPGGSMFEWIGVIPIDRSRSDNTVSQAVGLFRENKELMIVIAPTGTRKKVKKWRSGFYHIANGAGIPIALGFLDYGRKCGGIGGLVEPTGDIEADMIKIKAFYADMTGKYPEHASRQASVKVILP